METAFEQFIAEAHKRGICQEYSDKVDEACSNKELFELALQAKSMEWFCHSVADGWGLNPDYIEARFKPFLNGRFVYHGSAYTSAMYLRNDTVNVSTTASVLIDCQGEVHTDRICELYLVNSRVRIVGQGRAIVHLFNSTVINSDTFKGVIHHDK
jgi:hypothetical protein